jgi:hypothetical protein
VGAPQESNLSPVALLRQEYTVLFRYTVAFPEIHRFMRQETLRNNPRLKWVAETVLAPLLARLLPQIIEAQKQGLLPAVDPILFPYMTVSLAATFSEFGPEMQVTADCRPRTRRLPLPIGGLQRKRSSERSQPTVAVERHIGAEDVLVWRIAMLVGAGIALTVFSASDIF